MNYPDLQDEILAWDLETKESRELKTFGPGSHRGYLDGEDSYILGVAISDHKDDYYFPSNGETWEWMRYIQDKHHWVAHNGLYDMSWSYYEGFRPRDVADTMGLVKLLAEDRQPRKGFAMPYSLDACAHDYLGFRKNEQEILDWCKENNLRGAPQKWLWKMPEDLVGRYAKIDTRLTYNLYMKLIPQIEIEDMSYIWGIEKKLLPILADAHHRGLRIDNDRRKEASEELGKEVQVLEDWLFEKAGTPFKEGSGKQLEPIFQKLDLPYERNEPTEKMLEKDPAHPGNPSFRSEDMLPFGVEPDPGYFPHVLVSYRKLRKLKKDFVDRLEDFMVQGRIHPMVNPYGTKTGRPTAKTPNIFQIPKRGRGKKICRTLFIPEEGEVWVSSDIASEEYRFFGHYAIGRGADQYRYNYNTIPGYDMHISNGELAGLIPKDIPTEEKENHPGRVKAKTIGLGVLFGMGAAKMAVNLGMGEQKGLEIVERFHKANPSFKQTSNNASQWAKRHGFMRTLSKRRRRFPGGKGSYKALNFLTQGNSADYAKIMLVKLQELGVLDKVTFLLWLYDEFNFSIKEENLQNISPLFELKDKILDLKVPMELGFEVGPSWGEIQKREFINEKA